MLTLQLLIVELAYRFSVCLSIERFTAPLIVTAPHALRHMHYGYTRIDMTHSCVYTMTQRKGVIAVATNLSIDTDLLETALKTSGLKTKKETVNLALKEFIQRRQNADILSMFGAVAYDDGYDYKEARSRKQ